MRTLLTVAIALLYAFPARAQGPGWVDCNVSSNATAPWDRQYCPLGQTCAPNGYSATGWGCSPFTNATICDNFQSCPALSTCEPLSPGAYTCVRSGEPNVTSRCSCKPGPPFPMSATLKNVLVIGDSLSIGYTPYVAENLSTVALVQHAPWDGSDGGAEESAYLEQCLDVWLHSPSGDPIAVDLIWFNSGMHNLLPQFGGSTIVPGQYDFPADYAAPLANATARLVEYAAATGARLAFAMTTPWLCSTSIDGVITSVINANASTIMAAAAGGGIPVIDLHAAIVAECGAAPTPACFNETGCWCPHANAAGYAWLATEVIAPAMLRLLA